VDGEGANPSNLYSKAEEEELPLSTNYSAFQEKGPVGKLTGCDSDSVHSDDSLLPKTKDEFLDPDVIRKSFQHTQRNGLGESHGVCLTSDSDDEYVCLAQNSNDEDVIKPLKLICSLKDESESVGTKRSTCPSDRQSLTLVEHTSDNPLGSDVDNHVVTGSDSGDHVATAKTGSSEGPLKSGAGTRVALQVAVSADSLKNGRLCVTKADSYHCLKHDLSSLYKAASSENVQNGRLPLKKAVSSDSVKNDRTGVKSHRGGGGQENGHAWKLDRCYPVNSCVLANGPAPADV
jgi:hypothetical protein